jgi:hypothetical protein
VKHYPLRRRARLRARTSTCAGQTGEVVLFEYAGRFRLERATGKIAAIDKEDWLVATAAAPTDCQARGLTLERAAT